MCARMRTPQTPAETTRIHEAQTTHLKLRRFTWTPEGAPWREAEERGVDGVVGDVRLQVQDGRPVDQVHAAEVHRPLLNLHTAGNGVHGRE